MKTYIDWEIAAAIEMLTEQAYSYSLQINGARGERGLPVIKNAHEKCVAWSAVTIIKQLQKELAESVEQKIALSKQIHDVLNVSSAPEITINIPDKPIPKRRKKADPVAS